MKITIVGSGYVGLVSGACFSEFGFDVTCVDKNQEKIDLLNQGKSPIYEPGLEALIVKNMKAERLSFTTNLGPSVKKSDAVFIAVGTPADPQTGQANLSYLEAAATEIAQHIETYTVVVTKSTVPLDTHRRLALLIKKYVKNTSLFDVVSCPEFLREGSGIEDFMKPDRVIIGVQSTRAKEMMKKIFSPLSTQKIPIIFTSPLSAELIKYANNCFLATKIAFINELADLSEVTGANIDDISLGLGLDHRIGAKFLNPGPGYGGSCFPKDTQALVHMAEAYGSPLSIVRTVIESNRQRKQQMGARIQKYISPKKGAKIAILGLTFKADTDDMRDSPSLDILPYLLDKGHHLAAFDPEGMKNAQEILSSHIHWGKNAYDVTKDADALVVITEWNEFKSLDFSRIKTLMKTPLVIDLRNLYSEQLLKDKGFYYIPLGKRPLLGHSMPKIVSAQ